MKIHKKENEIEEKERMNILISEMLQTTEKGDIQLKDNEKYPSQKKIKQNIPLLVKEKLFNFKFDSQNTNLTYSSNGRFLALNTQRGISAFDTKKLNVLFEREIPKIYDLCFLHDESFFAACQKYKTPIKTEKDEINSAVFIYDKVGRELHHLKNHRNPRKITFLPFHFLLASISTNPFVRWTDVTSGKQVADFYTKESYLSMNSNPNTAVLHCGNSKGTVTLWSPASKEYVSKIFCQNGPVKHIKFYKHFMITSDENIIKVFDQRKEEVVKEFFTSSHSSLAVSQSGKVAAGFKNTIKFFDIEENKNEYFYKYKSKRQVFNLEFQPFEDILSVGSDGFFNLLVPGAGVPYFDSYEENPFITKKQRQEREIKRLLEKIPYSLIGKDLTTDLE